MNDENNEAKMKGSKPPPPVPPRPSKSLIKEALAKTRRAHHHAASCLPSAPKNQINAARCSPPLPQPPNSALLNPPLKKHNYGSTRPVIYQSDNCRSRKNSQESVNQRTSEDKIHSGQSDENGPASQKCQAGGKVRVECDRAREANGEINNSEKAGCDLWERKVSQANKENDKLVTSDTEVSSVISTSSSSSGSSKSDKNWNDTLNRNHVNTLIDEMFASVLEVNLSNSVTPASSIESITKENEINKTTINNNTPEDDGGNLTVIVINDGDGRNPQERKVKFNDRQNHEFLINELQNMKNSYENKSKVVKRQRISSLNSSDEEGSVTYPSENKIQMNDWYGVNEGRKVRMSSCHITIDGDSEQSDNEQQRLKNQYRLSGLPPLPKSLSGFDFRDVTHAVKNGNNLDVNNEKSGAKNLKSGRDSDGKGKTKLEEQLAILWSEMNSLREQDLFLLSKLWFLNESIQDFRQILQEQEDKMNLTLCSSPTPSSVEDEGYFVLSPTSASSC